MPRHTNFTPDIAEIGFDFDWSEEKVWALDEPVVEMDIRELEWHLDYPFFWENGGKYNLKPREVIMHPQAHDQEYVRVLGADLSYPLDVMENNGRMVLLDGLHRLTKAVMEHKKKVKVRIIPRTRIPDIIK